METYHFRSDWPVEVSAERAWEAIVEAERWPGWGRGFRRVTVRGPGRRLEAGAVADAEVRGVLPYSLRFSFRVERFEPPRLLAVRSWGDIVGTGSSEIEPVGGGVNVIFRWDVGLTNRLLDALGRLSLTKRLLAWNHHLVMADAYRGFRAQVVDGR